MKNADEFCPVEHARAMHAGNPSPHKAMILLEAGHKLPSEYVPQAVRWLRERL
jgi:hypothetical protein